MPTYLCHGFRWQRRSIRVHVVLQDLDDAAPEWIIKERSARNFIESFYKLYPFLPECTFPGTRTGAKIPRSRADAPYQQQSQQQFRESSNSGRKRTSPDAARSGSASSSNNQSGYSGPLTADADSDPVLSQSWSPVKLLEEHDPANLEEVSRPYAYVADYARRIDASCSIVEEIQRYEARVRRSRAPAITGPSSDEMLCKRRDGSSKSGGGGWFEQLRDQLQKEEQIRWYVVVNGDEERAWAAAGRPDSLATVRPDSSRTSVAYSTQQPGFDGEGSQGPDGRYVPYGRD